jgi:hypothetical protein
MLVPSLVTFTLATVAALFSINTKEEVFKVSMGFLSGLSALLTVIFPPFIVKVLIVVIPLVLDRLNYWSAD